MSRTCLAQRGVQSARQAALSAHCHPVPNVNSDRPWPCVQHHCLIKRCMVVSCFMGLCAHIPPEWGISAAKQCKGKFCYTRALRELILPAPLDTLRLVWSASVPSDTQGTKDAGGHVLATCL